MDKKVITFDDTEIEECKFHQHNKILVSKNEIEIYSDKENSKEIYSDDSDTSDDSDYFYEENSKEKEKYKNFILSLRLCKFPP